ncbi:rubrerythrin [Alkalibaculum sp. M08DMB]|uniref:Rubrerythrin n=1 Tax=Alkalibaculum sporogenes TaxID=2655001 RepID=A0A6A7K8Y1_9FIRM|nr:ferritin family protein [Alkalibaculum sporogenes]MPW25890.1 rubrerythrin [Alkalibaculum sporogenes]
MNSIEFAINMELEGEKYYTEQAELNRDNNLSTVFLILAKDERDHADILRNKSKNLPFELNKSNVLTESKGIFKQLGEGKSIINDTALQLDVYKSALDTEKRSIDLYKDLLDQTEDEREKEVFEFLVEQEEEHYKILNELIILLTRPEEWIESAEFGIRKDY